jgi:hypothetical protein
MWWKIPLWKISLAGWVVGLIALAAWVTSVLFCIKHANWLLLIVDAIAGPIGVIHGVGLWFGFFG